LSESEVCSSPCEFQPCGLLAQSPHLKRLIRPYVTPPVPFVIQNSISLVTPDTANNDAAANSQRPKPRPVNQEATAPTTAPPAPTGAITLPIQLMKFRKVPSGCAPVCP